MRLRIDLDSELTTALQQRSRADLRPVDMEAEALLRHALGLPMPVAAFTMPSHQEGAAVERERAC
jgi:hypothetical protein